MVLYNLQMIRYGTIVEDQIQLFGQLCNVLDIIEIWSHIINASLYSAWYLKQNSISSCNFLF